MGNINEKMLQMVVDMAANGGRMEAHKWQGGYWERCCQAVKHDGISSLSKDNVKAFLHALAALYLLNNCLLHSLARTINRSEF